MTAVKRFPDLIGTFMGRDALSLAVSHLKLGVRDTVLLPAYTCQEVLKSFAKKVNVVFYDVRPDLTIDPDDIGRLVRSTDARMLLTTDYFGFLQPYRRQLKQLCEEHRAVLIEDCAHSLLTESAGSVGDLAIYSFRKILPVPDGGGLRVNSAEHAPVVPDYYPRIYSNALSMVAIAKSRLNIHTAMLSRARVASHTTDLVSTMTPVKKNERILPLSYFSSNGMAGLSFDDVLKRRRADFQFWLDVALGNPSLEPVFAALPPGVCPLGFPVRVSDRAVLESRARSAGIPLSVHWRLDPTLAPHCRVSQELSKQLLTLPLYPDATPKQRDILAGIVARDWRRCA